jgi:uncharacterized SAM-binding protein YcdF (DUF218 family)
MYLNDVFTVTVNMAGCRASPCPPASTRKGPAARPAADRPPVRRGDAVPPPRQVIEDAAISGGTGTLLLEGATDAETAPRLLAALGVSPDRLILEHRSRDTYENALYSRDLARPQPDETWLLVTSAFHMPRSIGVFRKAGFTAVPWPTDYRTAGNESFGPVRDNVLDALGNLSLAIREWLGLIAYHMSGRMDELLPGPEE